MHVCLVCSHKCAGCVNTVLLECKCASTGWVSFVRVPVAKRYQWPGPRDTGSV